MPSLWTPKLREEFHSAVEDLYSNVQNPLEEKVYRESLSQACPTPHTLRLKYELQMADHIAFLAHSQEGTRAISAACVEETHTGFTIRLASNHTPSLPTVECLRKILHTFEQGARLGKARKAASSREAQAC